MMASPNEGTNSDYALERNICNEDCIHYMALSKYKVVQTEGEERGKRPLRARS